MYRGAGSTSDLLSYRCLYMVFLVGINVPRSRFLPVKTTSDLLIIMSNLYSLRAGFLEMNPKRSFPSVPLSKLGSHFTKVCHSSGPQIRLRSRNYFSYFSSKTYVVGTQKNCLNETVLLSTLNTRLN